MTGVGTGVRRRPRRPAGRVDGPIGQKEELSGIGKTVGAQTGEWRADGRRADGWRADGWRADGRRADGRRAGGRREAG
ncbi:MAG: hypothetical protein JWL72_2592, partial [Ilumatobacteraceae bacterium]|nr:hypothetical protein [Ilumatobacteraceae bacterium]